MERTRQQWARNIIIGRKALGLSQAALAHRLGMCQQSVSVWERGESAPRDEAKCLIAGVLHQRVEMLFPLEPIQPSEAA